MRAPLLLLLVLLTALTQAMPNLLAPTNALQILQNDLTQLYSYGYGIQQPVQMDMTKGARIEANKLRPEGMPTPIFACVGKICGSNHSQIRRDCALFSPVNGAQTSFTTCINERQVNGSAVIVVSSLSERDLAREACKNFMENGSITLAPAGTCPQLPLDYSEIIQKIFFLIVLLAIFLTPSIIVYRLTGSKLAAIAAATAVLVICYVLFSLLQGI